MNSDTSGSFPLPYLFCPTCQDPSPNIVGDWRTGGYFCRQCGTPVEEVGLDPTGEGVGTPSASLERSSPLPDSSPSRNPAGTENSESPSPLEQQQQQLQQHLELQQQQQYDQQMAMQQQQQQQQQQPPIYRDKKLRSGLSDIYEIAQLMNLSPAVLQHSRELFAMWEVHRQRFSRSGDQAIIVACLFQACRMEGTPRTFKEFTSVTGITRQQLHHYHKKLLEVISMAQRPESVNGGDNSNNSNNGNGNNMNSNAQKPAGQTPIPELIFMVAQKFSLPPEITDQACRTARYISQVLDGKRNTSIAGVALLRTAKQVGYPLHATQIANAMKIGASTLRGALKSLETAETHRPNLPPFPTDSDDEDEELGGMGGPLKHQNAPSSSSSNSNSNSLASPSPSPSSCSSSSASLTPASSTSSSAASLLFYHQGSVAVSPAASCPGLSPGQGGPTNAGMMYGGPGMGHKLEHCEEDLDGSLFSPLSFHHCIRPDTDDQDIMMNGPRFNSFDEGNSFSFQPQQMDEEFFQTDIDFMDILPTGECNSEMAAAWDDFANDIKYEEFLNVQYEASSFLFQNNSEPFPNIISLSNNSQELAGLTENDQEFLQSLSERGEFSPLLSGDFPSKNNSSDGSLPSTASNSSNFLAQDCLEQQLHLQKRQQLQQQQQQQQAAMYASPVLLSIASPQLPNSNNAMSAGAHSGSMISSSVQSSSTTPAYAEAFSSSLSPHQLWTNEDDCFNATRPISPVVMMW